MKLEALRHELRIIPESDIDRAYLEEVIGAMPGKSIQAEVHKHQGIESSRLGISLKGIEAKPPPTPKYPVKYGRDHGERITPAELASAFADFLEILAIQPDELEDLLKDVRTKGAIADYLDRELIYGTWGDIATEIERHNLFQYPIFFNDLRGVIFAIYCEGVRRGRAGPHSPQSVDEQTIRRHEILSTLYKVAEAFAITAVEGGATTGWLEKIRAAAEEFKTKGAIEYHGHIHAGVLGALKVIDGEIEEVKEAPRYAKSYTLSVLRKVREKIAALGDSGSRRAVDVGQIPWNVEYEGEREIDDATPIPEEEE